VKVGAGDFMFRGGFLLCKPGITFGIKESEVESAISASQSDRIMGELWNFIFREGHRFDTGGRRVNEDDPTAEFFDQLVLERDVASNAGTVNDALGIEASGADGPWANRAGSAQGFQRISTAEQEAIEGAVTEVADIFRQH